VEQHRGKTSPPPPPCGRGGFPSSRRLPCFFVRKKGGCMKRLGRVNFVEPVTDLCDDL
jgi:hypothetical protein